MREIIQEALLMSHIRTTPESYNVPVKLDKKLQSIMTPDRIERIRKGVENGKKSYTADYKANLVLEMLREETHISEIAARESISRTQLQNWKSEFVEKAALVFSQSKTERAAAAQTRAAEEEKEALQKKVGQLTVEQDFLKKNRELAGREYGSNNHK